MVSDNVKKTYVAIAVDFTSDGKMLPRRIRWRDDRIYVIDKIMTVRPASSLKVGGSGLRYSCSICGRVTYLFFENGRWFVEEKVSENNLLEE